MGRVFPPPSFTIAQNYNRGIAYLVWSALRRAGWNSPIGVLIRDAYRRGRRAEPLVQQDWEALFERPIDQVRFAGAPVLGERI